MNDAHEIHCPSATRARFDDGLQRDVGDMLHWSVSLAVLATSGEGNTVFQNGWPIVAMAADQPSHFGPGLVQAANSAMNFAHETFSFVPIYTAEVVAVFPTLPEFAIA